jgi:hypothetical protein
MRRRNIKGRQKETRRRAALEANPFHLDRFG